MKIHIRIMLVFAVLLMLIPCIVFVNGKSGRAVSAQESADTETVKILFTDSNTVTEIPLEEYVVGAVMAQMPADFESEALKCQAVLARTYAVRRRQNEQASKTQKLSGADMSDDESLYLAYFTEKQGRDYYGDEYDEAYEKISEAVSATEGEILTYEDEPIIVAFHAVSSGKTESAENAWGEAVPYLISVDSEQDIQSPACEQTVTLTPDEVTEKIQASYPDLQFNAGDEENWLKIEDTTEAGTVLTVGVGESFYIDGTELANALGLSSACFEIDLDGESFTFTTRGVGHMVGLSQYGANSLAQDGSKYTEILQHYFPDTRLLTVG